MTPVGYASISTTMYAQGTTDLLFEGSIMMGLNDTIGYEVMSTEVGNCNIAIYFYYISNNEDI